MKALTSKQTKYAAIALAALVVVAALATGVGKTLAYFTTYAEAKGSQEILLGDTTTITERYEDWTKTVAITNSENSPQAVYVRAKAYSGSTYPLTYSGDSNWTKGEGNYYYYKLPLNPGETSGSLVVKISGIPEKLQGGENFNVVIVYETTPVMYDESGNAYADWNIILDNGEGSQGGGK